MKTLEERLAAEEQDEDLQKLKELVRKHVKNSRQQMSKRYAKWDLQSDVYRGVRALDEDDIKAIEMDEPEKLVVPMSFAQVQTFVAFVFLLFNQKTTFYEFIATGAEDEDLSKDGEKLLERDLRRNKWLVSLAQLLLDVSRFGLCITKHWWSVETQKVMVETPPSMQVFDGMAIQTGGTTEWVDATKFEGNRIAVVSPYNFFPDTRFPLTMWEKGSFVADESEWHINQLKRWEYDGEAYGVEHITPMLKEHYKKRGTTRLQAFDEFMSKDTQDEDDQVVCLTECQIEIIPKKYGLAEEDFVQKWVIRIANDDRVISAKPMGYVHDEFTYDLGQFSPDMHQQVNDSLTDIIFALQDVVSYLINARLLSVRKGLENQLIIDPSAVNMETVENRSPWITMKKGSPRLGVDKFIRQLNYQDNTGTHFQDAEMLMKIMQVVTGVNENAMGQFHGGRRSATEARAVNSGGAARMKVTAQLLWAQLFEPLGRKMHINQRQGISPETYEKVLGTTAVARHSQFAPDDMLELVGSEDHFVFDGTLQSEKGFIAQSLQELVAALMSNPEVMAVLPMDIGKMIEEIFTLRGINNVERFRLSPPTGPGGPVLPGIAPSAQGDPALQVNQALPGLPPGLQ